MSALDEASRVALAVAQAVGWAGGCAYLLSRLEITINHWRWVRRERQRENDRPPLPPHMGQPPRRPTPGPGRRAPP